jgi:sensor c-di-GMP phosphodiesterase-like protein
MLVVAEGVETEQQMAWLLEHGCHLGQGYYFSPPVPPDDLHEVIRRIELRLAGDAAGPAWPIRPDGRTATTLRH